MTQFLIQNATFNVNGETQPEDRSIKAPSFQMLIWPATHRDGTQEAIPMIVYAELTDLQRLKTMITGVKARYAIYNNGPHPIDAGMLDDEE